MSKDWNGLPDRTAPSRADATFLQRKDDEHVSVFKQRDYACIIEPQEIAAVTRYIAKLEAQIAAVAPAVDAQPVAIYQVLLKSFGLYCDTTQEVYNETRPDNRRIVYASAQSERLRTRYPHAAIGAALISTGLYDRMNDITGGDREARHLIEELISKVDPILETWHNAAMSQHTGEKDD
ncbi:hypothetical protein PQQ84_22480 [Paraburkholderia strydomiana]|uniref:hypothetical protein n=1 Tax=Paraburkholderia strydomiana TaxID=1245417 RepID=UPI0038BCD3BE